MLTGCLRIAKESIYTGFNNLNVFSITNIRFDEHFGFTDGEVRAMLDYYGVSDRFDTAKAWYDGYCFGSVDVYCLWDIINYCAELRSDPDAFPMAFAGRGAGWREGDRGKRDNLSLYFCIFFCEDGGVKLWMH